MVQVVVAISILYLIWYVPVLAPYVAICKTKALLSTVATIVATYYTFYIYQICMHLTSCKVV